MTDIDKIRDGIIDYRDDNCTSFIEKQAAKDPDQDWRAEIDLPLRGATYQRQGIKKWVLVSENNGFA